MGARKRLSSSEPHSSSPATKENTTTTKPEQKPTTTDPPIAPPKWGLLLKLSLFFLLPYSYLLFRYYPIEPELRRSILINAGMSLAGLFVTVKMIPVASRYVQKRNLFGYDINKKGTPQGTVKVPESLGIVVGIVFLVVAILFQYFNFTSDSNWLVEYNAALACICFMTLLGFVDDVLDVPWRVKLLLPSIAALPLLMAYAGHTTIVIPKPLVPHIGIEVLDLGWMYKLYMGLLAVFCTNSINIHAGINGLEVGQTVVIASAILIHNIMQIGASTDPEYKQAHAFSIYLAQPLLATSLALLSYNWYPSSVFVGDTYTYFAGMTMAVIGILGHFRRSLKAMQHSLSAGRQLELGGRGILYGCNWRNKADITSYYFTHFPDEANEELLWRHFKKWGDVREVYIAKRLNKEGRRYGFVRFKDVRDAKGLELRLDNIVWGMKSFRMAMADIGDVIEPDEDTEDRRRLDQARVLVRTPLPPLIRSDIIVRVGELEYKVWIVEEVGPDGGTTKRSTLPSEGWSEMITSDDDGDGGDAGPLEVNEGCNKENFYSADHLGRNEGQHHKGGGLGNNPGPLMTEEGCHKEKSRHAAQTLKVCSDKFCKVYSRQKTSSHSRARIPQMETQDPSLPHCSFFSADPNDTQTKNQKQNPVSSDGRLKSEIQCSDEMMLEAQHLCTLGKELGMKTDLDVLHNYASMDETLLIFFLPQVLNFLLSLPQLSGYIPCPRHRLPRFDPQTGLLTGTNDGTLVNFFLRNLGQKSEKTLCIYLLAFQAIACCFCFLLRYFLAGWYK
ncbi:UDP-N-acetylglucosamine--dolichyl-phosphate N-acetylglucosaminephosphotransferase [Glycine soja]